MRSRGLAAADARDAMRIASHGGQRGDPNLTEKLDVIEPEILNAEGRHADAFAAMLRAHRRASTIK